MAVQQAIGPIIVIVAIVHFGRLGWVLRGATAALATLVSRSLTASAPTREHNGQRMRRILSPRTRRDSLGDAGPRHQSSIAGFYSLSLATAVTKGLVQKAAAGGTSTKSPIGYLNWRTPTGSPTRSAMGQGGK
jgi:hypothetical protein